MRESQYKYRMSRVVVKLSGSIFDLDADTVVMREYADLFRGLLDDGIQTIIIAGGGKEARRYIEYARMLNADESNLDELGIAVSRLNARLLIHAIGDHAYPLVPTSLEEMSVYVTSRKVVVSGGLHPGQSTNATAALIAERVRASMFINATDVDGIYTADPGKYKEAKLIKRISVKELLTMLMDGKFDAGTYELMDIVALKVIERSRIPVRVIKATAGNIRSVVNGESIGTEITV
jgi:uridylate kinase